MFTRLDARALSRAVVSASARAVSRMGSRSQAGKWPRPQVRSRSISPSASLDQEGQLGLEVDEVAVDDDGQPEDHRRHEQGQQRTGELRGDPLAQGAVSRQDRVGQEHGQDQGTEQRSQFLEQVPASRRAQHGRGQRVERDQVRPQSSRAAPHRPLSVPRRWTPSRFEPPPRELPGISDVRGPRESTPSHHARRKAFPGAARCPGRAIQADCAGASSMTDHPPGQLPKRTGFGLSR